MTGHGRSGRGWLGSRGGLVVLGFLAIAGFFLFAEHRAHLFGVLPYLLLLACPLLHLLMHRRHGGHGGGGHHGGERPEGPAHHPEGSHE